MIFSETIEIVHSNLIDMGVFSEEDQDYRTLTDEELRLLEDGGARNLEDNEENKRLLE